MTFTANNQFFATGHNKSQAHTKTVLGAITATPLARPGHLFENNTIHVALIGCGGRGAGAVVNALATKSGPIKLIAMADIFPERLSSGYQNLKRVLPTLVSVPEDRRFMGFDAYQSAMDCLNPGDVAILTTPPAFRWVHFEYAIRKGLHVFMEKPVTVDGPTTRRFLKLAQESEWRNLKVGVGLMCRHSPALRELADRIHSGQIGDVISLRSYRLQSPEKLADPKPAGMSELLYQVQRFHSFLWASGGLFSDFYIYSIDDCCWMKNAWPIKAQASGCRHYRGDFVDQNFDNYSVEYTFGDSATFRFSGRFMSGCHEEYASYAHGTKGMAIISTSGHIPSQCRIYRGQNHSPTDLLWQCPRPEANPYQLEWDHLIDAIRNDTPYNEAKRGAEASLAACLGRKAAHTGQVVTWDQMLNCSHEFAQQLDKLTMHSPAPLQAGADGNYPRPQPGNLKQTEY